MFYFFFLFFFSFFTPLSFVSFRLGRNNKNHTGWFKQQTFISQSLETEKSKITVQTDLVPDEGSSWLANNCHLVVWSQSLSWVHTHGEEAKSLSSSSNKGTRPSTEGPCSWPHLHLITSQRFHLLHYHVGSQGFNMRILEGCKYSAHNTIVFAAYIFMNHVRSCWKVAGQK